MISKSKLALVAVLQLGVSAAALHAQAVGPAPLPDPPEFPAQAEPELVSPSDIYEYKALDSYSEPDWVTQNFVETGQLPPVEERLPEEPLVYKAANMPDGTGVYGDVMRHVIGGRPEGWNYIAGQSQGWGGIDIGLFECLTRTGPLFMVEATEVEPLPNLAKSWEWSEDGKELTVHLIEGAKWSDGDPFDAEDVMFYWEDHVLDPEITPLNGASPETFGRGTTLEQVDAYTVKFTFTTPFPTSILYNMAYGNFCPGPSHILKPLHPSHSDNSYDDYRNAFPPSYLNFPVMGAWVPVEYRPDDIVVMRRNPYYWKVDETGQQLPYLNELHYRLSTWADRDVQAVAGTGDFSNLEQAENYVESLRRAADPNAPARLEFGPRIIGYSLYPNLSGNGWGRPDERAQAVRELNRDKSFRMAVSHALDRQRLGNALVKGPFTAIYPGGFHFGTNFFDQESTVYYPYSVESTTALFEEAGLTDTDGNGFVNHPEGVLGGADVQVILMTNTDYQTDRNLAEGVVAMMAEAGLKVTLDPLAGNSFEAKRDAGQYDWMVLRNDSEFITAVQNPSRLAPVGPRTFYGHMANGDGQLDLLPFEEELASLIEEFIATPDSEERIEIMRQYQQVHTENLLTIGLTQYPGALIINKRFANIPPGAPIFMYNWAEDNIIRERVYVPEDKQGSYELHPETLPGEPGGDGPAAGG
jgi:peptide/nickel transport system substrate-binding protein